MPLSEKKTKGQIKKEQLIQEVVLLSQEHDLSELSVRELCAKLHFSTGSFYHYFKDKGELLAAIFSTVDDHLLAVEQEQFTAKQADNILLIAAEYARFNIHSGIRLIISLNGRNVAGKGDVYLHDNRPIFLILQRCFEAGKQSGEFAVTTATASELARMTLVVMRGYAFDWAKHNGVYDMVQKMTDCIACMLRGL